MRGGKLCYQVVATYSCGFKLRGDKSGRIAVRWCRWHPVWKARKYSVRKYSVRSWIQPSAIPRPVGTRMAQPAALAEKASC